MLIKHPKQIFFSDWIDLLVDLHISSYVQKLVDILLIRIGMKASNLTCLHDVSRQQLQLQLQLRKDMDSYRRRFTTGWVK